MLLLGVMLILMVAACHDLSSKDPKIYIYMCVCVCVCVCNLDMLCACAEYEKIIF